MLIPCIRKWRKEYFNKIIVSLGISVVAYIVLIANNLTNAYDGMWQGSYYIGYPWVISIGRWAWPIIGKARLNMSPEPFTTIVSLVLIVLSGFLVVSWFQIKDIWEQYAVCLASVINTSVCAWLSYRYMSPTFAVSYLLSIGSVYLIRREQTTWRVVTSTICLTLSMGSYQANLGCACLLVLLNIIWTLQRNSDLKTIIRFFVSAALCILASCILYKALWDAVLRIANIAPASYRGADNITAFRIITSLPNTIQNTFKVFIDYYFKNTIKHDAYQELFIHRLLLMIIFIYSFIVGGVRIIQKKRQNLIYYVLCIIMIPIAANIAMIISVDTGTVMIQQTMPMAVWIPFFSGSIVYDTKKDNVGNITSRISIVLLSAFLFGSFLMVSVDQHVMLTSRSSSIALINRIASDLDDLDEPAGGVHIYWKGFR